MVTDTETRRARKGSLELKKKHVYQFNDVCFGDGSCASLPLKFKQCTMIIHQNGTMQNTKTPTTVF